jgi:hypothetical protein
MKRVMSMLAIAGLCSMGSVLAAQTPPPATTPAPAGTSKPAKPAKAEKPMKAMAMTYTGCVAEGSKKGTFELKDATEAGSTTKETYDLKGKGLAAHVGHKVEVTGTPKKPATGNASLSVSAKNLKMVADKCS